MGVRVYCRRTTGAGNSHKTGAGIGGKEAEATEDSREGSCDKVSSGVASGGPSPKSLVIHRAKVHEILKMLDRKKASVKKTHRAQKEANDKLRAERKLRHIKGCRSGDARRGPGGGGEVHRGRRGRRGGSVFKSGSGSREAAKLVTEAAEKPDKEVQQVCKATKRNGCLARVFDRAEEEVHHFLRGLEASMEETVAATRALSCGTNDRAENERNYLKSASKMLNGMTEMSAKEIYEVVTRWRWVRRRGLVAFEFFLECLIVSLHVMFGFFSLFSFVLFLSLYVLFNCVFDDPFLHCLSKLFFFFVYFSLFVLPLLFHCNVFCNAPFFLFICFSWRECTTTQTTRRGRRQHHHPKKEGKTAPTEGEREREQKKTTPPPTRKAENSTSSEEEDS